MKMIEDSPEELLGDIFSEAFFPGHPLGLSIAGTPKTVRSFDREITRKYHVEVFNASNLIIVAAGNIEHERIVELALSSNFGWPGRRRWPAKAGTQNDGPHDRRTDHRQAKQKSGTGPLDNCYAACLSHGRPALRGRSARKHCRRRHVEPFMAKGASSEVWHTALGRRPLCTRTAVCFRSLPAPRPSKRARWSIWPSPRCAMS